ncbi:indole-2-monooxygenase-like [Panicum virgatum]|uniref:indole-2-monooxygenase-like n=1 Tax=Panicum virgatum TaxID=38727 RepID=UPI0019D68CA1|nr:indole-2-monooxygenase-like [Panicum virgatum]
MAKVAQQFMLELTAPRSWMLLLRPLLLLLVRCWFRAKRARDIRQQQDDHLPPSPPALPVLGHLHLVGSLPHVSLRSLARKHGYDLMLLRLGAMPVVVVSSPSAAEAVLRTHDHVFASRPFSLVADVVMYGTSDIGTAPYGDYWRRARKLVTTHLLTVKRVQSLRHAREEEVSRVMALIGEAAGAGAAVDVSDLLRSFANDLACRAVMGKSSSRNEGPSKLFRQLIVDTSPLLGGFNVEEFFPFLARFGVLSKVVRAKSERLRRRWDELLDSPANGQYDAAAAASDQQGEDDDFIHVLLSVRQEYSLTRDNIKAILLVMASHDVFFAGVDTAASVLEYTVVELMQRPRVMRKLQAEVRSIVPKGQEIVSEADLNLNGMAYLRAVIKESLRLRNVTPLLAPHLSMASCSVDGFVVPAGVRVLVNAWTIGRDASYWGEDAEEFVPERFLDGGSAADVGFKGNDFQFLPFGAGRRQCPGMNFGMAAVEVMLANLVHRFDWEMPTGKEAGDIDMSEEFGLVVHRKEKLLLAPKLRG